MERCTDELDMASQLQEQANEQAIERQRSLENKEMRRVAAALADGSFDGVHCVKEDCGVAIPAARLGMNKMVCTDCAAVVEAQMKRRGK